MGYDDMLEQAYYNEIDEWDEYMEYCDESDLDPDEFDIHDYRQLIEDYEAEAKINEAELKEMGL